MSTPQLDRLRAACQRLRLYQVENELPTLLEQAAKRAIRLADSLDEVLAREVGAKTQKHLAMRIAMARFPFHKTLETFDFKFQPSIDPKIIRELATGLAGPVQRRGKLIRRAVVRGIPLEHLAERAHRRVRVLLHVKRIEAGLHHGRLGRFLARGRRAPEPLTDGGRGDLVLGRLGHREHLFPVLPKFAWLATAVERHGKLVGAVPAARTPNEIAVSGRAGLETLPRRGVVPCSSRFSGPRRALSRFHPGRLGLEQRKLLGGCGRGSSRSPCRPCSQALSHSRGANGHRARPAILL